MKIVEITAKSIKKRMKDWLSLLVASLAKKERVGFTVF
jgi:hypothetical protein